MKPASRLALCLALLWTQTAAAHHSFDAEFDRDTPVKLTGSVTRVDPKTYTSPWTVRDAWALEPETKLLEYACMENNRALFEGRIKPFIPPDDVD